ncbi:MAG: hypothetical protein FWE15_11015, partial [Actinomycetia bacterium]|nr:hypothetical protein [Actinomycetes bacterium]
RAEVQADIDEAHQLGISAVPTFVFEGQWAVQGGQETSTFLRVLEQVAQQTAAAQDTGADTGPDADPDAAACADGVCEVPPPSAH